MKNLKSETIQNINNLIYNNFGITYKEYKELDEHQKTKIVKKYQRKHKLHRKNYSIVMISTGLHAVFKKVKKGERVWINSGDESFFVSAGLTPQESRQRLDDRLDENIYSKPVAFVKKIQRRLKN